MWGLRHPWGQEGLRHHLWDPELLELMHLRCLRPSCKRHQRQHQTGSLRMPPRMLQGSMCLAGCQWHGSSPSSTCGTQAQQHSMQGRLRRQTRATQQRQHPQQGGAPSLRQSALLPSPVLHRSRQLWASCQHHHQCHCGCRWGSQHLRLLRRIRASCKQRRAHRSSSLRLCRQHRLRQLRPHWSFGAARLAGLACSQQAVGRQRPACPQTAAACSLQHRSMQRAACRAAGSHPACSLQRPACSCTSLHGPALQVLCSLQTQPACSLERPACAAQHLCSPQAAAAPGHRHRPRRRLQRHGSPSWTSTCCSVLRS